MYLTIKAKKNTDKSSSWLAAETATATGTSKNTVFNIRSEAARGPLRTPNKKRRSRGTRSSSRKVKYNDCVRSGIRRKVHEFYFKNQPPTLNSLLVAVNNDLSLPYFKRTTLYVLLKELGFVYEKRGNKAIMIERDDIVSWRHKYLVQIKKFRNERSNICITQTNLG
jgi:transposase